MAEYYPLISRAVAGLREGAPEARTAIYDRARQALIGQLRAMDPPVPEEAITRETAALDDAIARTEADITGSSAAGGAGPEPRAAPPLAADTLAKPAPPKADAPPKAPPPWKRVPQAPSLGGAERSTAAITDQAAAKGLTLPVRPATPRSPLRLSGAPVTPVAPAVRNEPPALTRDQAPPPPEVAPVMPAATTLRVEPVGSGTEDAVRPDADAGPGTDRSRDEPARPAAPRPAEERRPSLRIWIVAIAALAAVVAIAVTAWRLRDNPAELARTAAPQAAPAVPDKIAQRAADPDSGTAPPSAANDTARTTDVAPATTPPAGTDAQAPASAPVSAATAPAQPATTAQNESSLPIAYKAAILMDAPDSPEKVKTYVGTVVWHAQSVPMGQGQPLGLAIQADISIPEADVQLMMQIRRNTEAQLPASHTMDLKFTIGANSPIGTIKQVSVPQMRQQDMPTGDPLAGIPVAIADNYFLVGLVRGEAEQRNLDLLRSRGWFDIPLLLTNGKASKITFEKGANGDHIFNEVLDSWKAAPN